MMEFFAKTYLLLANYIHKKVPSKVFGRVLSMLLNLVPFNMFSVWSQENFFKQQNFTKQLTDSRNVSSNKNRTWSDKHSIHVHGLMDYIINRVNKLRSIEIWLPSKWEQIWNNLKLRFGWKTRALPPEQKNTAILDKTQCNTKKFTFYISIASFSPNSKLQISGSWCLGGKFNHLLPHSFIDQHWMSG